MAQRKRLLMVDGVVKVETDALHFCDHCKTAPCIAAKRDLAKKVFETLTDRTKPFAGVIEVGTLRVGLEKLFADEGIRIEDLG